MALKTAIRARGRVRALCVRVRVRVAAGSSEGGQPAAAPSYIHLPLLSPEAQTSDRGGCASQWGREREGGWHPSAGRKLPVILWWLLHLRSLGQACVPKGSPALGHRWAPGCWMSQKLSPEVLAGVPAFSPHVALRHWEPGLVTLPLVTAPAPRPRGSASSLALWPSASRVENDRPCPR